MSWVETQIGMGKLYLGCDVDYAKDTLEVLSFETSKISDVIIEFDEVTIHLHQFQKFQ